LAYLGLMTWFVYLTCSFKLTQVNFLPFYFYPFFFNLISWNHSFIVFFCFSDLFFHVPMIYFFKIVPLTMVICSFINWLDYTFFFLNQIYILSHFFNFFKTYLHHPGIFWINKKNLTCVVARNHKSITYTHMCVCFCG
jgi:hypothetical protein